MADVIGSIGKAVALAKKLLDLESVAKDAAAKLLIADLQLELAETKSRTADLIHELTELRQQLRAQTEKPNLVYRGDLYYTPEGDGPFCTACFDTAGKLVRVSPMPSHARANGNHRCNVCRSHYFGDGEKPLEL